LLGLPAGRDHCPGKLGYLPKSTTWGVAAVDNSAPIKATKQTNLL
jgi:hypothetical protein